MQLSEEEIKAILSQHIRWGARALDHELELEDLVGMVEIRVLGLTSAAHAIAEKLAEGVVWEAEGKGRHEISQVLFELSGGKERQVRSTNIHVWKEGAKRPTILARIFDELDIDGQLVTVTVRKVEERDGQGMD